MLISDEQALARLGSGKNLINQLSTSVNSGSKRASAMGLFGIGRKDTTSPGLVNAFQPKKLEVKEAEIKEDVEDIKVSFNPFAKKQTSTPAVPSNPQTQFTPASNLPATIPDSPKLDDLITNSDSRVRLGLAHDTALETLVAATQMLRGKLDDIAAKNLPGVITATSKVVESIRKERLELDKKNKGQEVHYHFYTPVQKKLSDYNVIEVG